MIDDDNNNFHHLIEKELNSTDKILKPDFTQKAGREASCVLPSIKV